MPKRLVARQLARYGVVGLASNGIAFVVYLVITRLGFQPEATAAGLYLIGASISYIGNYSWTFSSTKSHKATLPRFALAHVAGFTVQIALISFLYRAIGLKHQMSQLVTVGCVAVMLFLLFKYYVYARADGTVSKGAS